MSGSTKSIQNLIGNFKNWGEWAIWNDDQTLDISISEPSNEINSEYSWKSKIRELKDGKLVLTENSDNSVLQFDWHYGKRKRGTIVFNIEKLDNFTFTTCSLTIHNKRRIFAKYFSFVIKKAIQDNIDEVLLKIDERSM